MKNFIGFFDDKIIFTTKIQRGNGLPTTLSWDSLFTEKGFIVPYSMGVFNLLDILEEVPLFVKRTNEFVGCLVTPEGRVYEFSYGTDGEVIYGRLVLGKGFRHARSPNFITEETIVNALTLSTTEKKAIDWFHHTLPTFNDSYFVMTVDEIVRQIKERQK